MGKTVKIRIWIKFFFGTLIMVLVFSSVQGYIYMRNIQRVESGAQESIEKIKELSVSDSNDALNHLGTVVIKNQALATAKLVKMYLEDHPGKTGAELIADEEFQGIAIQPVGETGYTTVIKIKEQNMIAHPNEALMGKSLLVTMRENPKMQDWWNIVEVTWEENIDNAGYYQWPEADDTYSNKYMYLAVIDGVQVDGEDISIAATTYIDEFNRPVTEMEEKLSENVSSLIKEMNEAEVALRNSVIKILVLTFFVVIAFSLLFSRNITNPIKKLTDVARKVSSGDFETKADVLSNDELGLLAYSFNKMIDDLDELKKKIEKHNEDLEKKVKERTAELEDKNSELENLNQIMVNRELKFIDMKKRVKELEDKDKKQNT